MPPVTTVSIAILVLAIVFAVKTLKIVPPWRGTPEQAPSGMIRAAPGMSGSMGPGPA